MTVEWRPQTAAYQVHAQGVTGAAGGMPQIEVRPPAPGRIRVRGNPTRDQAVRAEVEVDDPTAFARTSLIEALERAGVTVDAQLLGANPGGNRTLASHPSTLKRLRVCQRIATVP